MSTKRFLYIVIISGAFCALSIISIDISQAEMKEVIAIRKQIPQLTESNFVSKPVVPAKLLPNASSTLP